ncbi:hypothetical protein Apa02nite_086650 [Actinoplanes palleronii]|uniref:HEAT repeat protein n=2 Tax=Actinoplanes palleronii TaxID=113570 RepID=A0ABQ4BPF9_9ACTN|nr:hypothetical protein Apa02nite_086650 [Actinoplanes palleronii]
MIYGMTETHLPLSVTHSVYWPSLERGSVVRKMLDDLAGGDEAARTTALRDLYRAAPAWEDVKPWAVAALPELLAMVADTARPDRGPLLRLVGDLAGADRTWQMSGETLRAKRLLAGYAGLTEWLTDEDPQVREAAAYTIRAVNRLTSVLPGLLWERYVEEPDPAVRVTLLHSSVITGAVGSGYELTKVWLAWVADSDADLRVRITALTELVALLDPSPFDAPIARDTLLGAYRDGLNQEPASLEDDGTPLLTGRRMAARQWTPGYPKVVTAVRAAFGNDVAPQLDLLEQMVALDRWDARQDALNEAPSLVQRLRGPYLPLTLRAAELLQDQEPQVRAAALRLLHGIGEIARPAADAVWSALSRTKPARRPLADDNGQVGWLTWGVQGPELGPAAQMLAELRDERVLPMLDRLLDEAPEADDLHRHIAGYGPRARALSRTLRRRLRALRPESFTDPDHYEAHRAGLLDALTAVAPNDAIDHLNQEPIDVVTLGLLARAGRTATGRIPGIRAALTVGEPAVELAAAHAIWLVAGDTDAAAEVFDRHFDERASTPEDAVAAIDGLGRLGIRAKSRARRLTRLTRRRGVDPAVVVAAADALWRVAGDREAARSLGRVWESTPAVRPRIARLWAVTGDARYAFRYARAELDTVLRHNASKHHVLPAAQISEDERLLALCRKLVAQSS